MFLKLLRELSQTLYYWKLLMGLVVLLYVAFILRLAPDEFGLDFNSGVKAALFAFGSATTLFVGMLPRTGDMNGLLADLFGRLVGASTACLAGWYWLSYETQDDPFRYLVVLAPIFAFLGISVLVVPFVSFLAMVLLGEGPSQRSNDKD